MIRFRFVIGFRVRGLGFRVSGLGSIGFGLREQSFALECFGSLWGSGI